jgi:hypothetical protein
MQGTPPEAQIPQGTVRLTDRNNLIVPQDTEFRPTRTDILPRFVGVGSDYNSDDFDCEGASETESLCNIRRLVQGMCFHEESDNSDGERSKEQDAT